MRDYRFTLVRVIDGDTIEVDIDLGFDIILKSQRIRLYGIDTPEIHSSDQEEKHYGLLAKEAVEAWLASGTGLRLVVEEKRDKFGRILGDVKRDSDGLCDSLCDSLCEYLVKSHMAVKYHGQNKEDVSNAHLANRKMIEMKDRDDSRQASLS